MKKLWDLSNPSDPITFEADTIEIAASVVGFLGSHYGATEVSGDQEVPIFLFGGLTEYLTELWGCDVEAFLLANAPAIADALDSMCVGGPMGRELYNDKRGTLSMDEFKAWRVTFDVKHRSSMNDISTWCWDQAENLRTVHVSKQSSAMDADRQAEETQPSTEVET